MSDKAKYGYFAGIIDGEGCLTIGAGQKETCINYNAIMCVQNTSKTLIDWHMTCIRSHFSPDNIEGIKAGDEVYFHVTNLEQDWDVPHGFAIKGANNGELLIMPGETQTLKWVAEKAGMFPFYCTDFCSALHQEMQGYLRVSPAGSNTPLMFSTGKNMPPVEAASANEKK